MNYPDPNQQAPYGGGYPPQQSQPTDPYSGQQYGSYGQPSSSGQQQNSSYQQPYGQAPYGQQPPYGQQAPYQSPYGQQGTTSMGLNQNTAAWLSYLFGWITGLIFFLMEKQNRFVRFHAMQSILLSVAFTVVYIVLSVLSSAVGIFGYLNGLVSLASLVIFIIMMVKASRGEYYKLPVIGDYAEKYANQGTM